MQGFYGTYQMMGPDMHRTRWRLELGATVQPDGVRFRVWAPKSSRVDAVLDDRRTVALDKDGRGYFTGIVTDAGQGCDIAIVWLLTPVGLRSLAPGHRDDKPAYFGDLRARDAAYHQGTVWAWLIGHYLDARRKAHAGGADIVQILSGFEDHMREGAVGTISEIFDSEAPHHPRGCVAQAWSVAEVLRAFYEARKLHPEASAIRRCNDACP